MDQYSGPVAGLQLYESWRMLVEVTGFPKCIRRIPFGMNYNVKSGPSPLDLFISGDAAAWPGMKTTDLPWITLGSP